MTNNAVVYSKANNMIFRNTRLRSKAVSPDNIIVWLVLLNQIIMIFTGFQFFLYLLFAVITFRCILKHRSGMDILLLYLILPNKYLQLAGCIIFAIKSALINRGTIASAGKVNKNSTHYIVFCFVSLIINIVFNKAVFINGVLQIAFLCTVIYLVRYITKMTEFFSTELLSNILIVEVIAGLMELIVEKSAGDSITGTFSHAHWYAAFLITILYALVKQLRSKGRNNRTIVWVFIITFMVVLADAKHVYICFPLALLFNALLDRLHIKNKIIVSTLTICMMMLVLVLVFSALSNTGVANINKFAIYVLNPQYNKKFTFYKRLFEQMASPIGLLGFGPGQFGSQVSITMGKDVLFAWRGESSFFNFISKPYEITMRNLLEASYINNIQFSSMVLGYPLSSLGALIGENGLIGIFLFGKTFQNIYKNDKNSVLWIFLILLFFFDMYFEIACVAMVILCFNHIINTNNSVLRVSRIPTNIY